MFGSVIGFIASHWYVYTPILVISYITCCAATYGILVKSRGVDNWDDLETWYYEVRGFQLRKDAELMSLLCFFAVLFGPVGLPILLAILFIRWWCTRVMILTTAIVHVSVKTKGKIPKAAVVKRNEKQ